MKEAELTEQLAKQLNWSTDRVEKTLAALADIIGQELMNGNTVSLHGLGQFEPRKKAERISVNPANNKRYIIPPKLIPVFKPAAELKSYIKTLDNHG